MNIHLRGAIAAALFFVPLAAAQNRRPPTIAEAEAFMDQAEAKLLDLSIAAGRADWVHATYITPDTEILAAQADERQIAATVAFAKQAARFTGLVLPPDLARKMKLLKLSLTLATPSNPKESEELTRIVASLEGAYGRGKYCPGGQSKCLDLEDITRIMAASRDPAELLDVWRGWRTISPPMRPAYARFVELSNKGARAARLRRHRRDVALEV